MVKLVVVPTKRELAAELAAESCSAPPPADAVDEKHEITRETVPKKQRIHEQKMEGLPLVLIICFSEDLGKCATFAMELKGPLVDLFAKNRYVEFDLESVDDYNEEHPFDVPLSHILNTENDRVDLVSFNQSGYEFYGVFRVNMSGPV